MVVLSYQCERRTIRAKTGSHRVSAHDCDRSVSSGTGVTKRQLRRTEMFVAFIARLLELADRFVGLI